MSDSLQHNNSQPQSANSSLLPDEQVLWEGDRKKSYKPFWVAGLIQILVLFVGVLALFDNPNFIPALIVVVIGIIPVNFLFIGGYRKTKTHYILTNERLIVQHGVNVKTSINVDFAKILELHFVQKPHNAYVELISPDAHVPSSLHPTEKVREFYESLNLLCRFTRTTEETARLRRLYNPPWKPWLTYVVVSNILLFVYLIIPLLLNWSQIWAAIYYASGNMLLSARNYRILLPLFLDKEYKTKLRFSPLHTWIDIAFKVIILILVILLFWNNLK